MAMPFPPLNVGLCKRAQETFKMRGEFCFVNCMQGAVINYLKTIWLAHREMNDLGNETTEIFVLFL